MPPQAGGLSLICILNENDLQVQVVGPFTLFGNGVHPEHFPATRGNHYIRCHGGKPRVLKSDAFEALIDSDACFARKLNETDSLELMEKLRDFCRTGDAAR
jgi:hypothetical protein